MEMKEAEDIKLFINDIFKSNYQKIVNHLYNISQNEINYGTSPRVIKTRLKTIQELYISNKQLFKNHENPNSDSYYSLFDSNSLEDIYDNFINLIERSKVKKYAKSFVRSYKHLLNEESYDLFSVLMENNIDRNVLSQEIRKIASFNDSETLNKSLSKIISNYSNGIEHLLQKIDPDNDSFLDVQLLSNSNNIVVIKVNDFEASEELGSSQWCISTDESYYDEYLRNPDTSIKYNSIDIEDSVYDENYIEGTHIFYYNFNLSEDNLLSKIAFTISANGNIVAAHDKNDNDILENIYNILPEKDLISITKKALPYISESVYKDLVEDEYMKSIENGAFLILNTRNPLNIFSKIIETKEEELINNSSRIILKEDIIKKSYEDFFKYNEISPEVFINDIFNYYNLYNKVNELYNSKLECEDEEEYDFDEDSFEIDTDISLNETDFFNENFNNVLTKTSDLSQRIIFEKSFDILKKLLNKKIVDIEQHYSFNDLSSENFNFDYFKNELLSNASSFLLNKNTDLTETEKSFLLISHVLTGKEDDSSINNSLFNKIKNNEVNINIIINNLNNLKSSTLKQFTSFLNENPDTVNNLVFKNEGFYNFINHNIFINNLNNDVKNNIRKTISRDIKEIYEPHIKDNNFSFGINLFRAKESGIIDNDIAARINDSRISFGSQEKLKLFLGDNYKGFKQSLIQEKQIKRSRNSL